jgi:enediyne biosynthesis protein E4
MRDQLVLMAHARQRLGLTRTPGGILLGLLCASSALALEWTPTSGGRCALVNLSPGTNAGFTALSSETTGIRFANRLPAQRHLTNQVLLNGSGVAAGDVDGDGWCDLFFCGLGGQSALYRNRGRWRFEDASSSSGLALTHLDATGAALADLDGDGDLDLIVNSVGQGTLMLLNDGRGRFSASPAVPVLNHGHCGTSLALADLDGDGALDVYVANYRTSTLRDRPDFRFTIQTVGGEPRVVALNGRPLTEPDLVDRFAFRYTPKSVGGSIFHDEQGQADLVLRNLGGGGFAPVSWTNGWFVDEQGTALARPPFDWGLSVMVRDLNGDGAPDLYVCNDFTTPDRIWINDGRGRFRALPGPALRHTSLSTMAMDVADIDRDGHDDIFTADMLSREHWRRLVQKNDPNPNMHLFVDVTVRPQYPRNMLQLGRGDGTYAEIAQMAGLEASEWTWTPAFLDVDLDGYEDLLVVNGFERDYMNMDANRKIKETQMRGGRQMPESDKLGLNRLYPRLETARLAFHNLGDLKFAEVGAAWGFDQKGIAQGMCLADLDNDGDLDVVINNFNDTASLLRNEAAAPRVAVRLKGRAPNTAGIGARLRLLGGAVPMQSQEMICGGRYLSCDEAMRTFAAGSLTNRLSLEVTWRSGLRSTFTGLAANRIYEIEESSAGHAPALGQDDASRKPVPLFRDASALLDHRHSHEARDDFERQPLLPNRLSTLGPGVSWFDLDGDGRDELIVAGGKGSRLAVFHNTGHGKFTRLTNPLLDLPLPRSQTTVLGWRKSDGRAALLAGSSNYEEGPTNIPSVREFLLASPPLSAPSLPAGAAAATALDPVTGKNRASGSEPAGSIENLEPGSPSSTGPLALADVAGDGTLGLFVGGRCVPGRWPEPASSLLFRQAAGAWVLDQENSRVLAQVGLVSGAVFADLDGDGDPDLVLACEWGPLRVFRNDSGHLVPWDWRVSCPDAAGFSDSQALTLGHLTGWWNGVTAGDFDGDGRLDLVASNWGRNTKYERFRSRPLRLLYGNFNRDDSVALVESWFDDSLRQYVPIFNIWTLSRSLPWLLDRFSSFESFSRTSVEEALGDRLQAARRLEATWLDSTLFLNRGGHFEARALPLEAQMAPAFAVCVADFDGDGTEDLFLSQNFFGVRPETSRYDAGRGLLLRGNGRGGFTPWPGQESGLLIYGEQRGAAACDFDGDGRVDLALAQVDAETKLFRNESARPGLRVRLRGPPGNPHGIGAVLRLTTGAKSGPAREVHAGAGYWSQDSAIQVLAGPEAATGLSVRWPGGKTVTTAIPPGAAEIWVDTTGKAGVLRTGD